MLNHLFTDRKSWLETSLQDGPVISSRVRLARNFDDHAFPGWADDQERIDIWNEVSPVFEESPIVPGSMIFEMNELSELEKGVLCERHLISPELSKCGAGSGIVIGRNEHIAVMINEEDHLRIQTLEPGLNLYRAYEMASEIDDRIEEHFSYAFSSKLGYLTACPSNIGTGMRASVMLHLPGLVLMEEMGPILNGISKIGLAARGLWGEGTAASGNIYQISNQITLGKREDEIIFHLEQIVLEIIEHERNARERLMESHEIVLRDNASRAYGLLKYAKILSSAEAIDLLSALRLGVDLGISNALTRAEIDSLFMQIQPAHLQHLIGEDLESLARDVARADHIRSVLEKAKMGENNE